MSWAETKVAAQALQTQASQVPQDEPREVTELWLSVAGSALRAERGKPCRREQALHGMYLGLARLRKAGVIVGYRTERPAMGNVGKAMAWERNRDRYRE